MNPFGALFVPYKSCSQACLPKIILSSGSYVTPLILLIKFSFFAVRVKS